MPDSLIHPVQRLPNELLLDIFENCCDADGFDGRVNDAMHISSVCSRWRYLATGCSGLWSRFDLNLPGHSEWGGSTLDPQMPLVDLLLERSRDHDLYLSLSLSLPEHPILVKLAQHASRWQELSLTIQGELPSGDHPFPTFEALDLPVLESLKIYSDDSQVEAFLYDRLLPRVPKVCTFRARIQGQSFFILQQSFAASIRDLTYEIKQVMSLRTLLVPYQNLKRLSLEENIAGNWLGVQPNHILPCLESLSILYTRGVAHLVLSALTTPVLKELRLTYDAYAELSFRLLDSFISRSSYFLSLRILSLVGASLSDDDTIQLLESLPLLESLHICDPPHEASRLAITSRFLESLHAHRPSELRPSATEPLLRNLQMLKLTPHTAEQPFNHKMFVETIQSRWVRPGTSSVQTTVYVGACKVSNLKSVELDLDQHSGIRVFRQSLSGRQDRDESDIPQSIYNSLLYLEEAGMRITIKQRSLPQSGKLVPNLVQFRDYVDVQLYLAESEEEEVEEVEEDSDED